MKWNIKYEYDLIELYIIYTYGILFIYSCWAVIGVLYLSMTITPTFQLIYNNYDNVVACIILFLYIQLTSTIIIN